MLAFKRTMEKIKEFNLDLGKIIIKPLLGYVDFIKMTDKMSDLYIFEFKNEDIVRNKFLIELTNRYDKYRSENDM
jgi:hypothetical protein